MGVVYRFGKLAARRNVVTPPIRPPRTLAAQPQTEAATHCREGAADDRLKRAFVARCPPRDLRCPPPAEPDTVKSACATGAERSRPLVRSSLDFEPFLKGASVIFSWSMRDEASSQFLGTPSRASSRADGDRPHWLRLQYPFCRLAFPGRKVPVDRFRGGGNPGPEGRSPAPRLAASHYSDESLTRLLMWWMCSRRRKAICVAFASLALL